MDVAKKGQEVCVKIEPIPGESPKMYGRHFEATDILVSKVSVFIEVAHFREIGGQLFSGYLCTVALRAGCLNFYSPAGLDSSSGHDL